MTVCYGPTLTRIANALERIVEMMEEDRKPITVNVETMPSEELKASLERHLKTAQFTAEYPGEYR